MKMSDCFLFHAGKHIFRTNGNNLNEEDELNYENLIILHNWQRFSQTEPCALSMVCDLISKDN